MKQGKGFFFLGDACNECGQRIGPGSAEQPAYWAWETHSRHYGDRTYYHRSCARKVSKRREAAREAELREARAYLATGKRA